MTVKVNVCVFRTFLLSTNFQIFFLFLNIFIFDVEIQSYIMYIMDGFTIFFSLWSIYMFVQKTILSKLLCKK